MNTGIRTWWANAFFITATVLLWLSIAGAVISGVAAGVLLGHSSGSGSNNNGVVTQMYTDPLGNACDINDAHADSNNTFFCP